MATMSSARNRHTFLFVTLIFQVFLVAVLACSRTGEELLNPIGENSTAEPLQPGEATSAAYLPMTQIETAPIVTPTPDQPRVLPTARSEPEEYIVQPGDSLNKIARSYQVRVQDLVLANNLPNPDLLEIGMVLTIPAPTPGEVGPDFKILPDSELVYGPKTAGFNVSAFVESYGGYLAGYMEEIEERTYSGAQIVQRIAQDYSVNPRVLLTVIEYFSGWVTQTQPQAERLDYPIATLETWRKGLYLQLAWAANNLNRYFYLWEVNGIGYWILPDGSLVPIDPTLNSGTAAVQGFFALLFDRPAWEEAVIEGGFLATYQAFFGYPFQYAVEPLIPEGLTQPEMQLPFEEGEVWSFTGGPHGGWGDGSAWAALDFAPPGGARGCVLSDSWVVAAADGLIVRADQGAVLQDLDGDGLEQTGWVVLYMHIDSRERVEAGTYLQAGDRIGHPSCEGGVSTGTHVHLARRYNGEWISADQALPFELDGWVSRGDGAEYNGFLERDGDTVEAWEGNFEVNKIQR